MFSLDPMRARFEGWFGGGGGTPRPRAKLTKKLRMPSPYVPSLEAGACPKGHTAHTKVYDLRGKPPNEIAKCKCNDCGETWEIPAEQSLSLHAFCARLAELLEDEKNGPERGSDERGAFIRLSQEECTFITDSLRDLLAHENAKEARKPNRSKRKLKT